MRLPLSLMPKGVEHYCCHVKDRILFGLPLSLMPKGVEHTVVGGKLGALISAAVIPDAERR